MAKQSSELDRSERLAKKFLEGKGLEFVDQNFSTTSGDIDLIFHDSKKGEYILIEVKTRRADDFEEKKEAMTQDKFESLLNIAEDFFFGKLELPETPLFRIDAVIVRLDGERAFCEHLEEIGLDGV